MPRRNPARGVFAEMHLAQRIQRERDSRGWSLEGLAKRMADAGCPINQSAIYKIEQGNPPRRITVDELVGFSRVFDLTLEELLLPPDVALSAKFAELLGQWTRAMEDVRDAEERAEWTFSSLRDLVSQELRHGDELEWALARLLATMVPKPIDISDRIWHARKMHDLTGFDFWNEVWLRYVQSVDPEALTPDGKQKLQARAEALDPVMDPFWEAEASA